METVENPPAEDDELHLLTSWGAADDGARTRTAGTLSVALHIAGIVVLLSLPKEVLQPLRETVRRVTPLIAPVAEPTQPTPNKGPLNKELHVETILPRPRIQVPPSLPSTTRPAAPTLSMPVPKPTPAPAQALPEPPKIEAAEVPRGDAPPSPIAAVVPPPQIQPQEKPRLAFEAPAPAPPGGGGTGKIQIPSSSVSDALRAATRGGAGGGLIVGDVGMGMGGIGQGMNLPPSPGRQGSTLELLSDPKGVDFRPYLIQILANVRRNWWAVMPESAKMGRRGRVAIQFAINRNGSVPKLVIVGASGTDALDRAAVAGISASNPFPPLPNEFKGEQVRLQFTFVYNMPTN